MNKTHGTVAASLFGGIADSKSPDLRSEGRQIDGWMRRRLMPIQMLLSLQQFSFDD
jgi:hypothetical protein